MIRGALNTYWSLMAQPLVPSDHVASNVSSPAPTSSKLPATHDQEPIEVELNTVPAGQRPGMLVRATSSFVRLVSGVRQSEKEERDAIKKAPGSSASSRPGSRGGQNIEEEEEEATGTSSRPGLTKSTSGSNYGTF